MKMPEIYETANRIRDHLLNADQTVDYFTSGLRPIFRAEKKKI